jgi:pimeloyl-ACP methyl ester carboxylesterase
MAKRSKWRKGLSIGCLSVIVLILVLSQFVSSCVSFSKSDKEVEKYFEGLPEKPVSETYQVGGYQMHYKVLDKGQEATLVFVHGTPGSWDAFISYFKDSTYYNQAVIISPDRPGFGKSSFGKPVASLEEQCNLLAPILEKYPAPRILIGHSLGGPVVARMAMDHPNLVEGIVMLAPAIAPGLEPEEDWFRVPMRWPVIEGLVPMIFRISNEEVIFLKEELELMLPLWSSITVPSVVIQGEEDKLVAPGNGPFADSMLVNAPKEIIMLEGQNHFLPWNEYPLIKETVMKMLSDLKAKGAKESKQGS